MGRASEDCLEICFVGLVVGESYVICHSCHVYEFGGANKWGDILKSSFVVAMQATRLDNFYGEGVLTM